jgi:hypothetical protein
MSAVPHLFPPSSPSDLLRAALMRSLAAAHRPELADLVAAADLDLDFPGLWLQPHHSGLSAAWLEAKLWAAAVESGLPLAWIRVLPESGRGGEA